MKKTIPFNLFGKQQELGFTISGLAAFERVQGKSIQQIVQSGDAGFNFCLTAFPICLENIAPHLYEKKIEKCLDEGYDIVDIAVPIVEAIAITGALGKGYAERVKRKHYPEQYPSEPELDEEMEKKEETEKNE